MAKNNNTFSMRMSTIAVDRHGEVVLGKSLDTKNYKLNPIVLVNHDYRTEKIIGQGKNIKIDDKGYTVDINLRSKDTPEVKNIKDLLEEGYTLASSIGFKPRTAIVHPDWAWNEKMSEGYDETYKQWREDHKKAFGKYPKTKPRAFFPDNELLEVSIIPVPANQFSVSEEKGFSDSKEEFKKEMGNIQKSNNIGITKSFMLNEETIENLKNIFDTVDEDNDENGLDIKLRSLEDKIEKQNNIIDKLINQIDKSSKKDEDKSSNDSGDENDISIEELKKEINNKVKEHKINIVNKAISEIKEEINKFKDEIDKATGTI